MNFRRRHLILLVATAALVSAWLLAASSAAALTGDINSDGKVDVTDLSILLTNYGKPASQAANPQADINGNGTVDILDLSQLLTNFGRTGTPTPSPAPSTRFFEHSSPFNTPASGAVDTASATMVGALNASTDSILLSWSEWSVPLYMATNATPKVTVTVRNDWGGVGTKLSGVPWPAGVAQDSEGDGHLSILNSDTGCLYDFWQMNSATKTASWGNRDYISGAQGDGVFTGGVSARGSGFNLVAGMMRPDEFGPGRSIDHALVATFPDGMVKGGGPVRPATESDGRSSTTGAIPEGARLRLKASYDLSGLPDWQRRIGQALKTYGLIVGDRGGSGRHVGLFGLNTTKSGAYGYGQSYPWGSNAYPAVPAAFIDNLEVMALPPQQAAVNNVPASHPCGNFSR